MEKRKINLPVLLLALLFLLSAGVNVWLFVQLQGEKQQRQAAYEDRMLHHRDFFSAAMSTYLHGESEVGALSERSPDWGGVLYTTANDLEKAKSYYEFADPYGARSHLFVVSLYDAQIKILRMNGEKLRNKTITDEDMKELELLIEDLKTIEKWLEGRENPRAFYDTEEIEKEVIPKLNLPFLYPSDEAVEQLEEYKKKNESQ